MLKFLSIRMTKKGLLNLTVRRFDLCFPEGLAPERSITISSMISLASCSAWKEHSRGMLGQRRTVPALEQGQIWGELCWGLKAGSVQRPSGDLDLYSISLMEK